MSPRFWSDSNHYYIDRLTSLPLRTYSNFGYLKIERRFEIGTFVVSSESTVAFWRVTSEEYDAGRKLDECHVKWFLKIS